MNEFTLDRKLAEDCIILGTLDSNYLLLNKNSLVPWFILVPQVDAFEFYELEKDIQITLLDNINSISTFIKDNFQKDKLNIAMIGNIVKQLHIHIIGRNKDDYCWPGVVWGTTEKESYSDDQINSIKDQLIEKFQVEFTLSPASSN